jgi:hypothetical protein
MPLHLDNNGFEEGFDYLLTSGEYRDCELDIQDLSIKIEYPPWAVVALCGKVLKHGVRGWSGKKHVCIAHFFWHNVFAWMGIPYPNYTNTSDFEKFISPTYRKYVQTI